jgi:hypothetical protein
VPAIPFTTTQATRDASFVYDFGGSQTHPGNQVCSFSKAPRGEPPFIIPLIGGYDDGFGFEVRYDGVTFMAIPDAELRDALHNGAPCSSNTTRDCCVANVPLSLDAGFGIAAGEVDQGNGFVDGYMRWGAMAPDGAPDPNAPL